ncbi:MAG: Holliday junction branch migration protein RuvA [Bacilli bacterium]|jgi:Holliday junction DNA helicase RuvA|nr:Holliday junction branch migration protein RuvA [Bacilli bacterium]
MYFYLKGEIALHQKNSIVIDVNGVGYQVMVSHPEDYPIGERMLVYTFFFVREDDQFLVGFKTFEEKMLFAKLISVKGVGPKTAIAALGSSSPEKLAEAINNSNLLYLTSLNGVGNKAASQIILDLRGKITLYETKTGDEELDDALEGLKSFGFSKKEITDALSKIPERGLKASDYISRALVFLSHPREVK